MPPKKNPPKKIKSGPIKSSSIKSSKLRPLEFRVWRRLQQADIQPSLQGSRVLVACSGGLDSIALMECLGQLAPRMGFLLEVVSVHHGASRNKTLVTARDRAFQLVKARAKAKGFKFHGKKRQAPISELKTEAELREYRHEVLREIAAKSRADWIAFAHHADDLFETRLIRLIRGTGPQGLRAMSIVDKPLLRPFLEESRQAILEYAEQVGLDWFEDPSNHQNEPLRNWLRNEWLPALEQKRPGASRAFARSLVALAENLAGQESPGATRLTGGQQIEFDRKAFFSLARSEQKQLLANHLLGLGIRDFTSRHIDELLKRLNVQPGKSQSPNREFVLLGVRFVVNARCITMGLWPS
jgi:tRNA(Ile)-lysidine synthase